MRVPVFWRGVHGSAQFIANLDQGVNQSTQSWLLATPYQDVPFPHCLWSRCNPGVHWSKLPFPSIFVVRTGTCMFFFWARCVLERTHVDACPRAVDSHSTDGGGSAFQVSPLESSMESVNIARQQGRKRTDCRKRPKGGSTASAYSNITGIVQPSRRVSRCETGGNMSMDFLLSATADRGEWFHCDRLRL